jgi:hypothetical protein
MPSRLSRLALVGLLAFTLSPGEPTRAAPIPKHLMPNEGPIFYSTRVGHRHVSIVGKEEWVVVVTKVERTPDGLLVTEERESPQGKRTPEQTILVSPKGLVCTSFLGHYPTPSLTLLKLPHFAGNEWSEKWGGVMQYLKTVGWETVETPVGKFRALRVDRDLGPDTTVTSYWYVPDLGCVKITGAYTREWKSFTPAK